MEVISFSNPDKQNDIPDGFTVIHEPITKLVSSNRGQYRIHVHFILDPTKDKIELPELPKFGILSIKQKDIRQMEYGRLLDCYDEVSISSNELDALIKRGVQNAGEYLIMDIRMTSPCEMCFRLRMMAVDKTFTNWTPWYQSEIPVFGRLLFSIPNEYIRIYDTKNYNLIHFEYGKLEGRTLRQCCICYDNHSTFNVFQCGHTACYLCTRKVEGATVFEKFPCPNCNLPTQNYGLICRRDGNCPIDGCNSDSEIVLNPCRCILSHKVESATSHSFVGTQCPYDLCHATITRVMPLYQSR